MRRYSLRVRLLALMIALTVLPVLVLTGVATHNTRASVEREVINANRTRVDWAAQYVEEVLYGIDGLFYSLQIDPAFEALLATLERGDTGAAEPARREIAQLLSAAYFANSRVVEELTLFIDATADIVAVDNVSSGRVQPADIGAFPWNEIGAAPIPLRLLSDGDDVYALHTINRFEDQRLRGAFVAKISSDVADRIPEILGAGSGDRVYLLNDTGAVVVATSDEEVPGRIRDRLATLPTATSATAVRSLADELVFARRADRGRITIAKTVPMRTVTGSARDTMTIGLLAGSALAVASIILSVVFSLRISRPISELVQSMREASLPDFNRMSIQNHDEVRLLEEGYRSLLERMKALAQKEYEQQIELKDARLMALQAQINPHFLNNTLNLLGGMALAKGSPEVYRLARAIGDMFRYAVGSEGDLVTLEQELEHVRNYLLIQENRFSGRCSITVNAEPSVLASRIPRFTLQPIVENAFEHGLQKKPGSWRLSVRCAARRMGTMVVVRDNGVGMATSRLNELRAGFAIERDERRATSIGLRNVDTRLRLHFGGRTGLRICSTKGEGTRVVFVLPRGGIDDREA